MSKTNSDQPKSSKKIDFSENKCPTHTTITEQTEPAITQTPKGGTKRLLTPSPVLKYQALKKSRQLSGDMAESDKLGSLEEGLYAQGTITVEPEYLAVPMDPRDITRVAAELKETMLPEITDVIQEQIPDIESIIAKAVDSAVNRISETLLCEITTLKTEVTTLKTENASIKEKVSKLEEKVEKLEQVADDREQYSRRNSIRITGFPEEKDEDTDELILNMARELNVEMNLSDIDRSHRVGKVHVGRSRAILVKFSTYRARRNLFSKRMDLREIENLAGIFINEDLTARRSELLYKARQYVRAKLLKSSYSSDGKIYVKDLEDKKHPLTVIADLSTFGELPAPENEHEIEMASA